MKNKVLQLLMLFCIGCFGVARADIVTIGTGTNYNQNSMPVKSDWNYFLTQQIFNASEIGTGGTINAISFNYYNGVGAFSMSDIQVYMKHVSKTQFDFDYDMVQVSPSDKVFDGTFSASGAGWVTVNLDTPFMYDGSSNLLICFYSPVNNKLGSNTNMFYYTNTPDLNTGIAYHSSNYIDITNVAAYSGYANRYNFRANIQIDITPMMSIPFTEDFSTTSLPSNWAKYSGLLNDVMNGTTQLATTTSGWFFNTYNGVFNTHARLNIWSNVTQHWLVTPQVVMQNDCLLSFDMALTKYSGTMQPVTPGQQADDRFVVLASTDNGSTWIILREWNNTGSPYVYDNIRATGEHAEIDLAAYQGTNLLIAFYGESSVAGGDNNMHIDNVSIDYKPLCWDMKVQEITLTNITPYAVTIGWDVNGGATVWEIQCSSDPNFNNDLHDIGVTDYYSSWTFDDLNPETTYYVRVAPNCPEGGYEPFSEVVTFTTPSPCAVPTNLTITNVTPHGVTATFEPGGDWQTLWSFMFTTTNEPPTYANGSTLNHTIFYPEHWKMFQSNTHYYLWVGVDCPEGSYGNYVWGEPAEFTTPEACPAVDVSNEVEIDDVQPHSVSLNWEAYQGMATQWQVFHNLYDILPSDEEYINEVAIVTDEPYVTIDGLLGDYDHHFWIRSYCGEWQGTPEWSSWSDMITVHTLVSCPAPTNLVARTTANSATITWSPGGNETNWTVEIMSEDWGDYPPAFEVDVPYITFDEEFLDGMIDDGDCYEKSFTVYVYSECGEEDGTSEVAELEFIVTDRQFFTVYDGDVTNNRIPANIYYFDDFTKSQFVIPAEELTEMIGTPISSMTFYTSSNEYYTTVSSADVYLMEVDYTSISDYEPKSSATNVYSGYFDIEREGNGGKMTINFSTPYTYQGGNLLVGIENTDDVNYKNIYFYGQTVYGASISGSNGSSTGTIPADQQNFIPKTTFGFLPACEPKSLPYFYGFEDIDEFNCWTKLDCHSSSAINSNETYQGNYSFRFRYNTTPPQYLISPKFESTTGMNVSFYYKNGSNSYPETFQVGYSTTTKSPNAFTWSEEVTAADNSTWMHYQEFFPEGTKYVAIKLTSNDQLYLYLDNFRFEPAFCMDEDQCELTFELTDSYGDTWNGNAIRVVDVQTNTVLAIMTNDYDNYDATGSSAAYTQTKTLPVCDGRELRFEWVSGEWPDECSYTVTDISGSVVFSGSGVMSEPKYFTPNCAPVFIANGFWNDGSNWNIGEVPEEGSDVIIQADAVIPAGYTAYAWDVTLDGGSITVEDGGQLRHNTNGLVVTMEKNIEGYGDANNQNNYYLMAFPFNDDMDVPAAMTAEGCDLYMFDSSQPDAEWRNNKQTPVDQLTSLEGYLFASPNDLELSMTGATIRAANGYYMNMEYSEGTSNFNGWRLLGNFFTCNAYIYTRDANNEYVPMDVMVYNEEGELVTLTAGPIAPMQGYFIKLTEPTEVYFLPYRSEPEGVINSKFTVNEDGDQVYFSQGNLQYIGSAGTPYWKFADKQRESFGDNGQGSTSQNVDRDLFGWGTSGYNHGAVCYQPWSTSQTSSDYYAYGNAYRDLNYSTGQADWGYNAIRNGGNQENSGWRTLTKDEWVYVFNGRNTASGIRFVLGNVNGVDGVILLPDNWDASIYTLNGINDDYGDYLDNTINATDWATIFEANGAVFLPKTVGREGTSITTYCNYWTSTYNSNDFSDCIFISNYIGFDHNVNYRNTGNAVRLVYPDNN